MVEAAFGPLAALHRRDGNHRLAPLVDVDLWGVFDGSILGVGPHADAAAADHRRKASEPNPRGRKGGVASQPFAQRLILFIKID
jgi:hypothetical protein